MRALIFLCIVSLTACKEKPTEKQIERRETTSLQTDPLPSWNDGALKNDIISYVKQVTDSSSSGYIPVKDRIATFDNDGTLWCEIPLPQVLFAVYRVKKMVAADSSLAKKQPFKAVLAHDVDYFKKGGEKAAIEFVGLTHTGMTEDEFETSVQDFAANVRIPKRNVTLKQNTYQPQIELLNYLRANGFNVFICTGGTIEFVRGISEPLYGVSKHNVIGTTFQYQFIDSSRALNRKPALAHLCDKGGKPVAIQWHIGQRPVFACGNERNGGDIQMLEFSQGGKYPNFQLLVNHDDSVREAAYQEKDSASLKAAAKYKWHVVSMKNDWKKIFVE